MQAMYILELGEEQPAFAYDGFPHRKFGPFKEREDAEAFYYEHLSDRECYVQVILTP